MDRPGSAPVRVRADDEIAACYALLRELRPHLVKEELVDRVRRQEREHGFEMVVIREADRPVALAGFRVAEFLAWGRVLYVDDLITTESARGRGFGGRLLDWLIDEARRRGCGEIHLDSGVHRFAAHRLYHARRMEISSHHFSRRLV